MRLGDHSAARGHIGSLKNKLQSLQHSVLMVLLEHVASGARLAVGNTHLFSDLVIISGVSAMTRLYFWCFARA